MSEEIHCTHNESPERERYHYTECGLENVYLLSGYERQIGPYGEIVRVKHADDLHRIIGVHLARDKKVLSGKELRFLRNAMDVTQDELGKLVSVTGQTVARWEKDENPVTDSAASIIRFLYLESAKEKFGVRDLLSVLEATDESSKQQDQVFELNDEWQHRLAA